MAPTFPVLRQKAARPIGTGARSHTRTRKQKYRGKKATAHSPSLSAARARSDDHFQLPSVFDDLLGQLRGRDGGVFRLLLLPRETVVVVGTREPPSLGKEGEKKGGGEKERDAA